MYLDLSQTCGAKQSHEWLWLADGEVLPLIKVGRGMIERYGSVPEVSHKLHSETLRQVPGAPQLSAKRIGRINTWMKWAELVSLFE